MSEESRIAAQDDALLARLRDAADRVDPVPELVVESARASFGLRQLDAQLAELVRDSALDTDNLVLVRGDDDDARLLSFESVDVAIELQVTGEGDQRILLGQVTGCPAGPVRVETPDATTTVPLDQHGRLRAGPLPAGPVRLHLSAPGGATVTTSWVSV